MPGPHVQNLHRAQRIVTEWSSLGLRTSDMVHTLVLGLAMVVKASGRPLEGAITRIVTALRVSYQAMEVTSEPKRDPS